MSADYETSSDARLPSTMRLMPDTTRPPEVLTADNLAALLPRGSFHLVDVNLPSTETVQVAVKIAEDGTTLDVMTRPGGDTADLVGLIVQPLRRMRTRSTRSTPLPEQAAPAPSRDSAGPSVSSFAEAARRMRMGS